MTDRRSTRVMAALTIAGSDSSGGAGIQADLKTFMALGVYGASVITALTAQNTRGVTGVHPVPGPFIALQLAAVADDLTVGAVKTGMLGDAATVAAVAAGLRAHRLGSRVVDPVMVATSGDPLLAPDAVDAVRGLLLPLADLVTPNLDEAARLLEQPRASTVGEVEAQARAILALGPKAVLVKGGHGSGDRVVDVLVQSDGTVTHFDSPRIDTPNTHGTGCTLSAAIAALIIQGNPLTEAARRAKAFVWQALRSGAAFDVGAGHGPVDHQFALRAMPTAI